MSVQAHMSEPLQRTNDRRHPPAVTTFVMRRGSRVRWSVALALGLLAVCAWMATPSAFAAALSADASSATTIPCDNDTAACLQQTIAGAAFAVNQLVSSAAGGVPYCGDGMSVCTAECEKPFFDGSYVVYPCDVSVDGGTTYVKQGAVAAAEGEAAYLSSEATCIASYAQGGSAVATGLPLCSEAISGATSVKGAVAELESELGCVQGQLSSPNPAVVDPLGTGLCGDVGAGLATARADVAYVDAERICIQSYLEGGSPSAGGPLCSEVISGVTTTETTVASAQQTANTAVNRSYAEASCVATQVMTPNPSAADPLGTGLCGDVGNGVQAADAEAAYAGREAGCIESYGEGGSPSMTGLPLCSDVVSGATSAKAALTAAQQELACIQGQLSSPSPTVSDPLGTPVCDQVGVAVQAAHAAAATAGTTSGQEQADARCAAGQTSSTPPSPGSGQTLCQTAKTAVGVANQEQADANCTASQATASPPSPSSAEPVCQTVRGAKQTVPSQLDQSDSCVSPAARTVFDGFAGSSYAKLVVDQPSSSDTAVCYRIDQGSFEPGGRLDIAASASTPAPTSDTNYGSCSSASGNAVAGQHPMFTTTGPPSGTDMVDSYADSSGDVWLCLEADPVVGSRVLVKEPSATSLPADHLDSPAVGAPAPVLGPVGYPSSTCQAGASGSSPVEAIDASVGGIQTWLYGWQVSPTKVDLCVRAQAPSQAAGVLLTIDATGVPGVTVDPPTITSSTTACTNLIDKIDLEGVGATVTLESSGSGSNPGNPAAVCVISPNLPQAVVITAGTTGNPTPPTVGTTLDPDTPLG